MPPKVFSDWKHIRRPGRNLSVVTRGFPNGRLTVVRVPSVANQKPIERWETPPSPFFIQRYGVHTLNNSLWLGNAEGRFY